MPEDSEPSATEEFCATDREDINVGSVSEPTNRLTTVSSDGAEGNDSLQSGRPIPVATCGLANIRAFRRFRFWRRMIWILVVLWFFGFGWLATEEEQRGVHGRQVEVDRLLATSEGIPVQIDGKLLTCDTAIYKKLTGLGVSVDSLNAALLKSTASGPKPQEFGSLLLSVTMDNPKNDLTEPLFFDFFLLIVLISPLIWWKYPLRILLLRPFAEKHVSCPLKKVVRDNVTGWGHVITLADRHINESFIRNSTIYPLSPKRLLAQTIVLPLFPIVRLPPLVITVRREKHLSRVSAALNNRFNLNFFSIFDTIRKVRATDALWRAVILALVSNVDLILVDLTVVKGGTLWELEQLADLGILSKCIFVAKLGHDIDGSGAMSIIGQRDRRVFSYDEDGVLTTPEDFEATVAEFDQPMRNGRLRNPS